MLAGYGDLEEDRILGALVWTKSNHWKHEREWRAYAPRSETNELWEDVPFDESQLTGVIIGARTVASRRDAIIGLVEDSYPHVELLQSSLMTDKYALDIQPLKGS
jgi:hypothetical protein